MGWSGVAVTDGQSTDVVSPGTPAFVGVTQVDNHGWECNVQLPTQDSDGTELTGMTKLRVCSGPMTDGANPFVGLSITEIEALPGVATQDIALSPTDAVPLAFGG